MNKIKSFLEYCENRDEDDDKGLADIDAMPNENELLLKLSHMAINRHQEKLIEFFTVLAKNDDDIKRILGKYRDKKRDYLPVDLRKGSEQEKDIVAPNSADLSDPI
jgi:hypothetical protein